MKQVFIAALLCLLSLPAFAQQTQEPTKESLVAAWELAMKESPHTKTFTETKEDGLYEFESALFPYKGKLKILTAFIAARDPYEGYYDNGAGPVGIVEAELEGAPKDFLGRMPYAYAEWGKNNRLFFSGGKWLTHEQWMGLRRAEEAKEAAPMCAPASGSSSPAARMDLILNGLLLLLGALLILAIPVAIARRKLAKQITDTNKLIMDRQLAILKLSEEDVALQREQVALLKALAEK